MLTGFSNKFGNYEVLQDLILFYFVFLLITIGYLIPEHSGIVATELVIEQDKGHTLKKINKITFLNLFIFHFLENGTKLKIPSKI